MAIPAIIAAAMRAAALFGGEAGGAAAATRVPTLTGFAAKPPPLPGTPERTAFESAQRSKQFGDNLRTINQQLAFANVNIVAFGRYIGEIPHKFVASATLAIDTLSHAAQPFVNLVSRNNPAVTKQWELALNDAYGVLGRSVIPIVQAFTRTARTLGDTMAGLEPVFEPAIQQFGQLIDDLAQFANEVVRDNLVAFHGLAGMLEIVTFNVRTLTAGLRIFYEASGAAMFNRFFGQGLFNQNATSMGAGIRSAKQVTAAEELQNDLIKNALMTGAGKQDVQERQVGFLEQIAIKANDIYNWIVAHTPDLPNADEVKAGIRGGIVGGADAAAGSLVPGLRALYGLFRTS